MGEGTLRMAVRIVVCSAHVDEPTRDARCGYAEIDTGRHTVRGVIDASALDGTDAELGIGYICMFFGLREFVVNTGCRVQVKIPWIAALTSASRDPADSMITCARVRT